MLPTVLGWLAVSTAIALALGLVTGFGSLPGQSAQRDASGSRPGPERQPAHDPAAIESADPTGARGLQPSVGASQELAVSPSDNGLHYTPREVELWQRRAEDGPYRVEGDAQPGSPGDWHRIAANADRLLESEELELWVPVDLDAQGGVENQLSADARNRPPTLASGAEPDLATMLRDAAFFSLVTGESEYREAVRSHLLEHVRQDRVDFSNRTLWPEDDRWSSGGGFTMANWLTKLLYAYDYLGADAFTDSERQALNTWFYHAAEYWAGRVDAASDVLFENRWEGNYALSDIGGNRGDPDVGYTTEEGEGEPIFALHRHYNNRLACIARYVGVAAQKLLDEDYQPADSHTSVRDLKRTATLFVEEWLTYSVFPEGFFGEFERWTSEDADRGLSYSFSALHPILSIANTFARAGDDHLFRYTTREGALGTESQAGEPEKNLLFAMQTLAKYLRQADSNPFGLQRYGTDRPERVGDQDYLIDSQRQNFDANTIVADIVFALVNWYYQNEELEASYRRSDDGLPGYERAVTTMQHVEWTGDWGTYPGMLFLYGQTERLGGRSG
jgi:hypothetical protein